MSHLRQRRLRIGQEAVTPERARLERSARRLAAVTIGYNTAEGVVAILAGVAAGSTALFSFGLDSGIEVLSAVAIAWQFRGGASEDRERRTLRFIALAFFTLAGYVAVESVRSLLAGSEPHPSGVGIALAASSVVVMPALVWAKRRVGRQLGSVTVLADSTQTLLCTYLSAVLLAGLVLNAAFGWGWADSTAALVIAGIAVREGFQAWRGEDCCAPRVAGETDECADACAR